MNNIGRQLVVVGFLIIALTGAYDPALDWVAAKTGYLLWVPFWLAVIYFGLWGFARLWRWTAGKLYRPDPLTNLADWMDEIANNLLHPKKRRPRHGDVVR